MCFLFLRAHSKLGEETSSFWKELLIELEKRCFLTCEVSLAVDKYCKGSCSLNFPEQILEPHVGLLE